MKHFVMLKAPANRKEKYLLLTTDGEEFEPFMITMRKMLLKNYSPNTIEQYAGHIARFIDYIYEAAEHLPNTSAENIINAFSSYRSYLLFGTDSEDELAKSIARQIRPRRVTSASSLQPIGAAIKFFLTLSEATARAEEQESLFKNLSHTQKRNLTQYEKRALKRNSVLAGVLRGGPHMISSNGNMFGRPRRSSNRTYKRVAMPFDKAGQLISAAKSYRDKTLYSLLAASGSRQHEALQLCLNDIDIQNRKVKLINPFTRKNYDLTESEYQKLAWKGRATETTFLIEPFKTAFFNYLELYIRHERIAHGNNSFLFQKNNGRPYFTTSRQTRIEYFRKLKKLIGLYSNSDISIHSLRHMYGTYTLNYLPLADRFGLPLPIVKVLMGHSSISSTEIYAKRDEDIIEAEIEYANKMIFGLEGKVSLNEIKVRYHKAEIDRIFSLDS